MSLEQQTEEADRSETPQQWSLGAPADDSFIVGNKGDLSGPGRQSLQKARSSPSMAWPLMLTNGHTNVLIEGSGEDAEAALRALELHSRKSCAQWSAELEGRPGTLVVGDVSKLTADDQRHLLEWIRQDSQSQVFSVANEPLYPLVQQGLFLEDLFYLLNVFKIDLFGTDAPGP